MVRDLFFVIRISAEYQVSFIQEVIIKFEPIVYLKSLGWCKQDVKIILMFISMVLIGCFIIGNLLRYRTVNIRIIQTGPQDKFAVGGAVNADVRWGQEQKPAPADK
jgi:hypothetical protein